MTLYNEHIDDLMLDCSNSSECIRNGVTAVLRQTINITNVSSHAVSKTSFQISPYHISFRKKHLLLVLTT